MLTLVLAFFYAHTGFADADILSYAELTLSLRWLTLTRVLLTPHPDMRP